MARVRSVFARGTEGRTLARGRFFALFLALFALILLVVNFASWRVYSGMRRAIERELDARLGAIAVTAAQPIDPDYVDEIRGDPTGALGALVVRDQFQRLRRHLGLANLVLLTADGRTLVDLTDSAEPLDPHPLRLLHPEAFAAARNGIEAVSELYTSLGRHYKNGYAPVRDDADSVVAVVAVEAGTDFFEALGSISHTMLAANAASAAAIILLGVIFYHVLRMQSRLEETMRRTETLSLMGEMAGAVAHEIKNPLGIIRATAERLRKRFGTGEEIFDYITEEVDRLDAILGTYLEFARGGGAMVARGRSDAREVIESVLRLVGRDLAASGVRSEIDVESGLAAAVDGGAMRQVFLNLVLNAREAMPGGGTIRFTAVRDGRHARFVVADTGGGIAREDRERIFQPFYSGRERGSGLGLAIVHRIVTQAGGTIEVESDVGKGTSFTIRVPLA
jgi:signal transduction histidine kinase